MVSTNHWVAELPWRITILLVGILVFAPPALGAELGSKEAAGTTPKTALKKRTPTSSELVDAIVNHNRAPTIIGGKGAREPLFDDRYRWAEQERVEEAIQRLSAHAEEAWSELVRHLDDKRYCITYALFRSAYNFSVGDICETIIGEHLSEAYYGHVPESDLTYSHLNYPAVVHEGKLKSWCQARSGKKLYELQIEMCEWSIRKLPTVPEVPDEDCRNAIVAIKRQIETLRKSKKPVLTKHFGRGGGEVFTLYTHAEAIEIRAQHEREMNPEPRR